MERIQSICHDRIAWCCADNSITQDQLASDMGFTATTMENVISGEGMTFNQLRKVADYFGRGVLFFLENEPVTVEQVHTPQFRTLANQKPEMTSKLKLLIERVEKQREVYRSLREDIDDADCPQFIPPDLAQQEPREAAQMARQWLGLSDIVSDLIK